MCIEAIAFVKGLHKASCGRDVNPSFYACFDEMGQPEFMLQ